MRVQTPAVAVSQLPAEEQQLVASVKDFLGTSGEAILKDTVEMNSGTNNRPGVIANADYYEKRFASLGFATSRVDLEKLARGVHLVATHDGDPSLPRFLLIGHLDTVFEPSSGFLKYENLGDGRVKGPGVSDMKGGNLVMLAALEALRRSGELAKMNVTVMLLGDEESIGLDARLSPLTSRAPLIEAAKKSDVALSFEPTNGRAPGPIVARRGSSVWSLKVTAPTGHSSLIFSPAVGPGAVFPAAQISARFYEELSTEPLFTFSVGTTAGGTNVTRPAGKEATDVAANGKLNIIAGTTDVLGDMRAISNEAQDKVRARMRAIADKVVAEHNAKTEPSGHISASMAFLDVYPGMPATAGNQALLADLSKVSEDLGEGPLKGADPLAQGAGDIAFAAQYVGRALDGLGPEGFDYHTALETTTLPSIMASSLRAALFLHRLNKPKQS